MSPLGMDSGTGRWRGGEQREGSGGSGDSKERGCKGESNSGVARV